MVEPVKPCNVCEKFRGRRPDDRVYSMFRPDDKCVDQRAIMEYDTTNGRPVYAKATTMREDPTACGTKAAWFEPWQDKRSAFTKLYVRHPDLTIFGIVIAVLPCIFAAIFGIAYLIYHYA